MRARFFSKDTVAALIALCAAAVVSLTPAEAQTVYTVKPVAQKKIKELPVGPLFWRVENFPTLFGCQGGGRSRRVESSFGPLRDDDLAHRRSGRQSLGLHPGTEGRLHPWR
jgi:hypothetical protein